MELDSGRIYPLSFLSFGVLVTSYLYSRYCIKEIEKDIQKI